MNKIILLILFCFTGNSYADSAGSTPEDNSKWADAFKDTFSCAGMYLVDHGMALHRGDGVFLDVKTFKHICTYRGIAAPICDDSSTNQTCTCPPLEWDANNCSKKYGEFQRETWQAQKKSHEK